MHRVGALHKGHLGSLWEITGDSTRCSKREILPALGESLRILSERFSDLTVQLRG